MNTLREILKTQKLDIEILINDYNNDIELNFKNLTDAIEILKENLKERDETIFKLSTELKDNDFNKQNYQNFSLVSNLSKQIRDKELELKTCQSQLRLAKKEIDGLKEKLELISEKDEIEDLQQKQTKSNVQLYIEEQSKLIVEEKEEPKPIEEVKPKKIDKKKKKVEEVEKEVEKVEEEEEEEEDEVSYVRKKIKGKYYFVSDENPPQIYEYLDGNEVGKLIGKMNDTKAEFFKKI
jgi:chromosome segregation ATPase